VTQEYVFIHNDSLGGFTINGHGFPATMPIVAKKGERVLIRYQNEGVMMHPWHTHGFRQYVVARDGAPLGTAAFYADTLGVNPGERFDTIVEADRVGVWALHCHILPHVEGLDGMFGMVTALVVTDSAGERRSWHPLAAPTTEPSPRSGLTISAGDDLPASSAGHDRAIDLAGRLDARLVIVNVLEKRRLAGGGSHERVDQARAERETHLVHVVRDARASGVKAEFLVWQGDPGGSIAAAADAEGADLVVVGTRGRSGAGRMLLGSVSDHVVRHAACPVLVVRPATRHVEGAADDQEEGAAL
jgi:nucleotide-binding universal stress UspA family protein